MFDDRRDLALMDRVKSGDASAFEEIFDSYKGPIAKFLYHLCWDSERAQDLLQEVFLRLWKSAGDFEGRGKFSTYLFQIARNLWVSEKEKESRRIRTVPIGEDDGGSCPESCIEDESGRPADAALDFELAGKIREAVASLDARKQMIFVLGEFEDMKYSDIAEILDIPVGTVKSRMASAERELRFKLGRYLSI